MNEVNVLIKKIVAKPKVRFLKFSEEWREYKSKDVFKSVSDKNHPNLPVLSASQKKGMIYRSDGNIDIQYNKNNTKTYKRVTAGQFVIHLRSFQGGFAYSEIEGITSPAYTVIDLKYKEDHNSMFWKQILTSKAFIKKLETITYGIRDGRSISFTEFSTLKFKVPSNDEQQNISELFKVIDNTIELQQQLLNDYKQLKKAMMQKMFPQKGESVPRVRFAGYTDDWEKYKLVDIAEFNPKCKLPDQFEYVDLESVLGTELVSHRTEYRNTAPSRARRLAKQGDIFFQTVRPYQKNNFLYNLIFNDYVFSTGYAQIRPRHVDNYLLFSVVQGNNFISNVLDKCTGTSYPAINSNDLSQIYIPIPKREEEQKKIGNFFKQLDETIILHEKTLETYQNLKKAMLQKMFV